MNQCKAFIKRCCQYDIVRSFIYSILLNMLIECFNRRGLIGLVQIFTNPVIFLFNTLIIWFTMSFAALFKRKLFIYSTVGAVWLLLAIINFAVLCSRKTPFTAMDIYLISDAIKVIPIYLNIFHIILIIIGVAAGIAGLVILWIKGPKSEEKINYLKEAVKLGLRGVLCVGFGHILLIMGILSNYFGNLANAYKDYGFAYCFTCSVIDRGISKSNEYSHEYVNNLKQDLEEMEAQNSQSTPNIIFLQLESFFDPNLVKGVSFSENPIPNFERLVKECSSGYLSVPCFGAGTANTEFEVQTGMNIDDFGPGEYPYKTVLQSKVCESSAYDLKNIGYATHALHNNDGTFYDRYKVFSHLGYDTFTSVEYMQNVEKTPMGWAKDKILTGEIEKLLNSTEESDYIYAISVQGHGDYPTELPEGYTPHIAVSGFFNAAAQTAFEYYVNQIYEMDLFIAELIENLSARDEETVLVMYGDHLPGFEFTDNLLENEDIYQTQYVIWSNFDMPVEKKDLESYQLSAYVLGKLGISEGYITKYHQKRSDSVDYLKDLKIIEYDILYGKRDLYGGSNPYSATNLKMGIGDITIADVYNYKDYVCVEGNNFNDYSVIMINDKEYPTEIINGHLLRVPKASVSPGNIVSVVQRGDDKIELSRVYMSVPEMENK